MSKVILGNVRIDAMCNFCDARLSGGEAVRGGRNARDVRKSGTNVRKK